MTKKVIFGKFIITAGIIDQLRFYIIFVCDKRGKNNSFFGFG